MMQLDCVIPVHAKDFETLGFTIASIRRCCPEVRRIVIVGTCSWDGERDHDVEFVQEDADFWPFRRSDLEDCGCPSGWLLQQLLKLYAPLVLPGLGSNVLVCDADVIWFGEGSVRFLEAATEGSAQFVATRLCTFDSGNCPPIRSAVDLHRYDKFVSAILPGLEKRRAGQETAVCHHACLQRDVLEDLFARIEGDGTPFWVAFREAAKACGGRASEYELYHAFACRFFPQRVVRWMPTFAVVADAEAAMRSPPAGVTFVVAHSHLRGLSKEELKDREGIINGDTQAEILRLMVQGHPQELLAMISGSGML
mmetsp:Transcript_82451/g.267065  ORF Transcript_82451/g.267065 Transcript_82451/m.267065 type:complete len:310 (-) Transcript_82451:21-950(-)